MSKSTSFRVGKVTGYLRGRVWYLCYFENGKRRRPRVGAERDAARQLAAQVNSQLETGAPSALSFEPISIPNLRTRWLATLITLLHLQFKALDSSNYPRILQLLQAPTNALIEASR